MRAYPADFATPDWLPIKAALDKLHDAELAVKIADAVAKCATPAGLESELYDALHKVAVYREENNGLRDELYDAQERVEELLDERNALKEEIKALEGAQ